MRNYRLIAAIRYWFKILQCDDTKYYQTSNMMIDDLQNSSEKPSWVKFVKSLLESLWFGHAWIEQRVGDVYIVNNHPMTKNKPIYHVDY